MPSSNQATLQQVLPPLLSFVLIMIGLSWAFVGPRAAGGVFRWIAQGITWTITRAVIVLILLVVNSAALIVRLLWSPARAGEQWAHWVERITDALLGPYRQPALQVPSTSHPGSAKWGPGPNQAAWSGTPGESGGNQ
jgi:hypothetical protein